MYDDKFLPKLSQNLLEILEDNEFYDVTIEVGNDPYVKIFRSHMIILNYRSSYLRRILSTNVNKKNNDGILVHIKLPNILPEIFQMILRYIYGGRLSLEEYDTSDIIKILIAANELSLQELITHLQSFLIENKKNWMEQNFNLIYKTSFENDSFSKLQNFYQSDNSKLESKIITKEISSKSIDSRIITSHHAELISKWIDKLENTDKMKNLYEFKLILRGSRDGFSPRKFHEICDYKSHTISIIKVTSSNEILGGYNPTMWKSGLSFGNTKDSFIFSFKNKKNVEENILSRVKDKNLAICNDPDFGPVFGGYEFCLPKDNILSIKRPVSYESISEVGRFSVEEFEVFQIIKD
ncbi:uncharacterized protein OCT59_011299 [Rhizophagus irregularis]|nr:hypothetical protein OCT59_011299 [Rhizophagus irregularis]